MSYTVTDILRDFAFYGHTESPLSCAQIERCIALGLSRDETYSIGCDCACGYRFEESLELCVREAPAY